MRILVIDAQGGGLGKTIIEKLSPILTDKEELIALGTNAFATASMIKSGAKLGATGENAIVVNAPKADIIIGTVGIVIANSMLGELTPSMALAISNSAAVKVLVPMNRCGVLIAGIDEAKTASQLVEDAVLKVQKLLKH